MIDWENIAEAGVTYTNGNGKADTIIASFPEHDQDGCPTENVIGLYDMSAGDTGRDMGGRRFTVLGAGSVQGSVIVQNEAGMQFHADLEHWLKS